MNAKLLLFAILCACQGGFTMFAMEENQPAAQVLQQNIDPANAQIDREVELMCNHFAGFCSQAPAQVQPMPIQPQSAMQDLNSFRTMALAFASVYHGRLGSPSMWNQLPDHILRQICDELKKSCYCCDFHNFKACDKQAFEEHVSKHILMSADGLREYLHITGATQLRFLAAGRGV